MLVLFTAWKAKQSQMHVVPFCRVNIGIVFQSVSVITSWHRYIRLLGSLTLHSETAVEVFIASQAPQTSSEEGEQFDFPLIPRKSPNIALRSINPRDFYIFSYARLTFLEEKKEDMGTG